jgi:hypothetical protein
MSSDWTPSLLDAGPLQARFGWASCSDGSREYTPEEIASKAELLKLENYLLVDHKLVSLTKLIERPEC